ncbi:hypothetical protein RvY_08753 [Ramazzottius varieornatus]|uniref:Uncharacterized protein n=1 Tax=Ramazzottius varieornatus TaxID=947166 RepID=A0A1D1V719_RAMVA|nr:hypothetical protein RvY_08753 [Ramazzottius varieornatus]
MPTSVSTDGVVPVGMEEPKAHIEHHLDTQIISVFSTFRLSDKKEFRANVESLIQLEETLGVFALLKGNTATIKFSCYTGSVRVQTNGIVKCEGQGSFEEAESVAKLVVGIFRRIGQEPAGLFDHRFTQIQATSALPFRVHLRNLQQEYPEEVSFDYSIQKGKADIRFDDLKAQISLGVSGKMNMFCSGDCNPVDYSMSKTLEAVSRVCRMANDCKLPDVERSVACSTGRSSGALQTAEELNQRSWGVNSVRRSERLQSVWNLPESYRVVEEETNRHDGSKSASRFDDPNVDFLADFMEKNGMDSDSHLAKCLEKATVVQKKLEARGKEPHIWDLFLDEVHAMSYIDCPYIELKIPQIVKKVPQKRKSEPVYPTYRSSGKKRKIEASKVSRGSGRPQPRPDQNSDDDQEAAEKPKKVVSKAEQEASEIIVASLAAEEGPGQKATKWFDWFLHFYNRPKGVSTVQLCRDFMKKS